MARDPAYIRDFKEFTRGNLNVTVLAQFDQEAYGGNDRARAIMLASVLETALDEFIESRLRPKFNSEDHNLLFDFNAPLGTFSAKTLVPYAFGMFGPDTKHDLDMVRILRNGFAHCRKPFDFETPEISPICEHLRAPDSQGAFIPHGYLSIVSDDDLQAASDKTHPRTRFIMTCFIVAERLLIAAKPDVYSLPVFLP